MFCLQHCLCSCRKIFVLIQEIIAEISKFAAERSIKMYLEVAMVADSFVGQDVYSQYAESQSYSVITAEFLSQAFSIFEERVSDSKIRLRLIVSIVGALLALKSLSSEQYEAFITKIVQYSAKMTKKHEQCQLVALCSHLFYPVRSDIADEEVRYSNPQRALECLQRCLKLADACTSTNPAHVALFVDLLEHYVFFFEKGNPLVLHSYISGLVALIKEHLNSYIGNESLAQAKAHFQEIIRYILKKKAETDSSQLFAPVNLG
jgi:vacuolar protein sorting-associated protein 35